MNRRRKRNKSVDDGSCLFWGDAARRRIPSVSTLILILSLFLSKNKKKGIYGAAGGRDDFCDDDVNFYFEYMGMLAVDGDYARLDRMKSAGLAAVDLLLLMAAGENDAPKVAEMLRAGADIGVKDIEGKTATELATNEQVLELLRDPAKARAF